MISIALAFNDAITNRDLAALGGLMTDDHTFIDSEGTVFAGRQAVLAAWKGFFDAFWQVYDDTPENRARLGVDP